MVNCTIGCQVMSMKGTNQYRLFLWHLSFQICQSKIPGVGRGRSIFRNLSNNVEVPLGRHCLTDGATLLLEVIATMMGTMMMKLLLRLTFHVFIMSHTRHQAPTSKAFHDVVRTFSCLISLLIYSPIELNNIKDSSTILDQYYGL